MAKLLMLQGLPACGKSHWARDYVSRQPPGERWAIIEKDEIRRDLEAQGWEWSHENEKRDVIPARDTQIIAVLAAGGSVISADTNFGNHQQRLQELARMHGAEFEVRVFGTSVEECIKRDALREGKAKVGEAVIKGMAKKYLGWIEPPPNLPYFDDNLMSAIICDLDGTLAHHEGRRNVYDASRSDEDACDTTIKRLIEVYYRFTHYQIIYVSGREEKYREPTETFLAKNHCPPGPLFMRTTGDPRNDAIVKHELYKANIERKYRVEFVLDDRPRVLRMWQSLGLFTLAVGDLREF
jgi:predicted kinase